MAKNDVTYRDLEESMKDITKNMAVVTALIKRKDYVPEELRRINQALGGAATLVNKAVSFARKMGESTSANLIDRLDDRLAEYESSDDTLTEKVDMEWLDKNVTGKKYKGMIITNSVYDDKEGKMVRFWVKDKGKIKEIRPIPKDELIKVLK